MDILTCMCIFPINVSFVLNKMFSDASKFKKIHRDPTLMRMNSLQRYLNGVFNKGEISEQEKKDMRPMASQLGRAHGLPKTHKEFDTIPKFCPVSSILLEHPIMMLVNIWLNS